MLSKFESFFKTAIHSLLRFRVLKACIICEELILHRKPLCKLCRKSLFNEFKDNLDEVSFLDFDGHEIPVLSLWYWQDHNSYLIRKTIVALKDGANPALYSLFASWMRLKMEQFNIKVSTELIAVPSYDRQHPKTLGQTFARVLDVKFHDVLIKAKAYQQKLGGKDQRKHTHIRVKKRHAGFLRRPRKVCVLDDVMVTGESIKSSIRALGKAQIKYIIVWAEKQ